MGYLHGRRNGPADHADLNGWLNSLSRIRRRTFHRTAAHVHRPIRELHSVALLMFFFCTHAWAAFVRAMTHRFYARRTAALFRALRKQHHRADGLRPYADGNHQHQAQRAFGISHHPKRYSATFQITKPVISITSLKPKGRARRRVLNGFYRSVSHLFDCLSFCRLHRPLAFPDHATAIIGMAGNQSKDKPAQDQRAQCE